jgi:two-component system NtrC family sensor kinase
LHDRLGLEKKFVVGLCAFVAALGVGYSRIQTPDQPWFAIATLTAVLGLVAWGIAHYVLFRPIRQLVAMARAVGAGDFSKRLRLRRHDAIGSLAHEMDTLCDQLQAAQLAAEAHIAALEQLRHSDRVATLGRLASSVAHELGNPLNVIELRAQLVTSGACTTVAQAQQNAVIIVEQTRRMTRIIDEILSFARMQPAKIAHLDLALVLSKALALCQHTSKKHHVTIALHAHGAQLPIDGDADKLLQIVVNLMLNGVQAMPTGGSLDVSTLEEERPPIDDPEGVPRTFVCITVSDHGVGIAAPLLTKVFDPFYSTKMAEGGTGLGLSVAQGIAREHGGWISVRSELGCGASFDVYLPKHGLRSELAS